MTIELLPACKTKIVCTIGPSSESGEILSQLLLNGMSVARLNFAHGTFESHKQVISNIRAAAEATGKRVAIMGDLPGPKMRIGRLAEEPVMLHRERPIILQTNDILGSADRVSVAFAGLPGAVKPGDLIFVNDGFILLEVQEVIGQEVHCRVKVGGELRSFKGVNLPGIDLGINAFTSQDHEFLRFAAEQNLDAVSQSFVLGASDILAVREAADGIGYKPFLIAKIERREAVENLEAILKAADGIMVARGDLGVEIPIEEIAINQKDIIYKANIAAKPVITATHMLESMTEHPRPTRAEATDVANAILDGTDCLMLSGETASGRYPVEAVTVMARIAAVSEPHCAVLDATKTIESARSLHQTGKERRISLSIFLSVEAMEPVAVIAPTLNGDAPRLISRFRLPVWIMGYCCNEAACQSLQFSYGVLPIYEPQIPEDWTKFVRDWLRQHGISGDLALLTHGIGDDHLGRTNQIEIVDLNNE